MNDIQQVEDFLSHHGVKGQRWGIRNENKRNKQKNAAIILGSAAAVTAITVGAIFAKKHFGVSATNLPKASPVVKNFAESMANEPVDILHASRGREKGFMFLRDGGVTNKLQEFDSAGFGDSPSGYFKRYGSRGEKVAVTFDDPEGRKDRSGRIIPHNVILPESMTKNVHNAKDAEKVAWPLIQDLFRAMYHTHPDNYGPGF